MKFLKRFGFGLSILIFGTVMASSDALAQCSSNTFGAACGSLALGGSYNTFSIDETTAGHSSVAESFGGGSILPSTLNGATLTWVYCVGLFTEVGVPAIYGDTAVSSTAMVYGMLPNSNAVTPVHNANEIAFLLGNFAAAAVGNTTPDINAQEALQAAIWTVEYDGKGTVSSEPIVTGTPGTGYYSQYENDLAVLNAPANASAVANTSLSTIDWFSPSNNLGNDINQPLVGASGTFTTFDAPTPEPASILFFGTVMLIAGSLAKRKYSKASR